MLTSSVTAPLNEHETDAAPRTNHRSTRGVRKLKPRLGRPSPFGVQWSEFVYDPRDNAMKREVKSLFFEKEHHRDAKLSELTRDRRKGALATASRAEIQEIRAFKAATDGTPWQSVVSGWRAHLEAKGIAPCRMNVDQAVDDYLARCLKLRDAQKLSVDQYRHKRTKLTLFKDQFGHLRLDAVPPREIELLIDDIEDVESPVTFDNYVKHFAAMFNYYIGEKVISDNPCNKVEFRSDGIGEVKKLTPAQTAQLFRTALTHREKDGTYRYRVILGRLALEAFVGLRFSSGSRIEKQDINFDDRGITLPRKKLKTEMGRGGRRRYIDQVPAQVWKWLAITPEECWEMLPRLYMRLKSELFIVAYVPHPWNCLRHGFATHDIAANKNPGRTATILCHKDQDELWEHYYGIATHKEGILYQHITPATCGKIAQGFEPAASPADCALALA